MNTFARRDAQLFASIGTEARHYLRLSIGAALNDLKLSLSACAWRPMFVDFTSSFRKTETYDNQSPCQRNGAASRR
jgi:hypothetical protein